MIGNQVRIDDREMDAILREAFREHRHGITSLIMPHGVINDARMLTLPDGEQMILRVAPTDALAEAGPTWFTPYGLRREAAVIAAASNLADFLPVTIDHDFQRRVIDRDWVIQKVMPGEVFRVVDETLPPDVREVIWQEIGAFTRRLHAVSSDTFGAPSWGPTFDRWSAQVEWDVAGLLDDAERFGYNKAPFARMAQAIAAHRDLLDEVTSPSLIHSDLNRYHLFVEQREGEWGLRGTIDLEFGRFADPHSESLIVGFEWDNAPVKMRGAFMTGYRHRDFTESERLRVDIYAALALGWFAPLLAMQGEPVDDLLARITSVLDGLAGSRTFATRRHRA
jgi:hypothetical protein